MSRSFVLDVQQRRGHVVVQEQRQAQHHQQVCLSRTPLAKLLPRTALSFNTHLCSTYIHRYVYASVHSLVYVRYMLYTLCIKVFRHVCLSHVYTYVTILYTDVYQKTYRCAHIYIYIYNTYYLSFLKDQGLLRGCSLDLRSRRAMRRCSSARPRAEDEFGLGPCWEESVAEKSWGFQIIVSMCNVTFGATNEG